MGGAPLANSSALSATPGPARRGPCASGGGCVDCGPRARWRASTRPRSRAARFRLARHVRRPQFDDDLRRARQNQLARRLDRLGADVGEDVDAAGRLEHVVQEAAAAARVDVAQRAALAAEDEQRARLGQLRGPLPERRELALDAGGQRRRLRVACPMRCPSARIVAVTPARPPWRYSKYGIDARVSCVIRSVWLP